MTGKTLCVFNEQFNGDYKTDYASAFVKLELLLDEQFTLTPAADIISTCLRRVSPAR